MNLLQMSLSGAVLILVIMAIRVLTVNRLPKRTFLVLWNIALIRLLVPGAFLSKFCIDSILGKNVPVFQSVRIRVVDLPVVILNHTQNLIKTGEAERFGRDMTFVVCRWIWLVGVVAMATSFLIVYLRCRFEFQTSLPVHNGLVDGWLGEHSLRRRITICQLTGLSTPLTYGVFRPVILMPKNTDWQNIRQVQYVLFHEYVHIRRFDVVSKLIATIALCLHWFNPFVWVLYILFDRDIELYCDECVVRHFEGDNRAAYARVLISMEEQRRNFAPLHNYFSKNSIEERITAIMKMKKTTILSLALAVFLVVGTAAVYAITAQARNDLSHEVFSYGVFPVYDSMLDDDVTCTYSETTIITSYVDPQDGKTYYSMNGGKTYESLTDEEVEKRFSVPEIEWWTYDEYKAWLENEKVQLQNMIGETVWTSGRGTFVWTQEIVDETIKMYEDILEDIKNGLLFSKTVDGKEEITIGIKPVNKGVATIKEH